MQEKKNLGTPPKTERTKAIIKFYRKGMTMVDIAKIAGVSKQRIWTIIQREKSRGNV